MIRRIIHIICSFLLAVLLLFGTTSKEFVHLFAGHTDTVHAERYGHEGPVIEQQHHHCDYIDFGLTPFTQALFSFCPVAYPPVYFTYQDAAVCVHPSVPGVHTALRGPPVTAVFQL